MCGFLNGQQPSENWKNYSIVKAKEVKTRVIEKVAEKEHKKEPRKPEINVEKSKDKAIESPVVEAKIAEDPIVENSERVEEDSKKEDSKEVVEVEAEVEQEIESVKESKEKYFQRENLRGKFEDYEDEIEASKEFDPVNCKIRGSIGEYFESIVEGFDRDYDSINELKYTKWYKIPVHDLHQMCNMSNYNKYTLAYYPMLNYYPYIKKYGYFVMGYKCDEKGNLKYIVYGVPGGKGKQNQPYGGRTGFVTWMQTENEKTGLWLMFYDYKKSMVVVPAKE